MRQTILMGVRLAAAAGAALLVAACGGGDEAANQSGADAPDANMMINAPANDASALESAANAIEPAAPDANGSQGPDAGDPLGKGGSRDTGGNGVGSNVSGM